jgi:ferredoxin
MAVTHSEKYSESSGVTIQIDYDLCAGFGDCVEVAPDVFQLNDENLAVILDPDAADLETLTAAAESCPVSAILLFDEQGRQIAPEM